jgi:hypothetical protein
LHHRYQPGGQRAVWRTKKEEEMKSGRTTRIVDQCVQDYFVTGIASCVDHSPNTTETSLALQKKVLARLKFEHRLIEGKDFRKAFNHTGETYQIVKL